MNHYTGLQNHVYPMKRLAAVQKPVMMLAAVATVLCVTYFIFDRTSLPVVVKCVFGVAALIYVTSVGWLSRTQALTSATCVICWSAAVAVSWTEEGASFFTFSAALLAITHVREPVSAAMRQIRTRVRSVTAGNLAGDVTYYWTPASWALVEEFSADWTSKLLEAKAEESGHFEMPQTPGTNHYLRFTWPGVEPLRLKVKLTPGGPPLAIKLREAIRHSE